MRWLPVTVNSQESLTFWFAARPMCVPVEGHVQQVVLKIDIACKSFVVLAEKESISEREEKRVVTWRDRIERLARQQRRLGDRAVARLQH
jgi:hypothetical protein